PYLLDLARKNMMASRLIHVVPVRTLLREIYNEKFKSFSDYLNVSYQSMDRIPGGSKSPYFLSDIIVTTLDSFLWNIYKIPVAEISKILRNISMGHYYPALAAIQTSIVVFDEAHVYIGEHEEDKERIAIISALNAIRELEVPIVLSTATMSSKLVEAIINTLGLDRNKVGVVYACNKACNKHVRRLEKYLKLKVEYIDNLSSTVNWNTRVVDDKDVNSLVNLVGKYCRDKIVLVVANTVERAVELYRKSKEKCKRATLIHSRLTEEDKEKSYNEIREIKNERKGLIVASPIIEVGVEVDADILITDEAPLENLIQRAGRLCRSRSGQCNAEVIILKNVAGDYPYDKNDVQRSVGAIENIVKNGRCIEWRLFSSENCEPVIQILDRIAKDFSVTSSRILRNYLVFDSTPKILIEELNLKNLYNLFRGFSMVKAVVDISNCKRSDNSVDIDCIKDKFFATSVETLRWLESKMKCLETDNDVDKNSVKALVLIAKRSASEKNVFSVKEVDSVVLHNAIFKEGYHILKVHRDIEKVLDEGEVEVDFFVKIKPECYSEGEGAYV
ncbi:MAG: CRISPR-associated helicase Cas3', partial [Acidilobaceae archaeon]